MFSDLRRRREFDAVASRGAVSRSFSTLNRQYQHSTASGRPALCSIRTPAPCTP